MKRLFTFAVTLLGATALAQSSQELAFTAFESGQVRPLAMSADASALYAVNTPDNRLEVFIVLPGGALKNVGSVVVGLEPVAVEVRSAHEVWVVNHLSDSISIVDVSKPQNPIVTRTLLVGDEPRDIVFAGPGRSRAFITTAHRGQNTGRDPQLTTPGVGRADVWVFDAANMGESLGGTPMTVITLFTDTPRALAVSPDGSTVYAAGFTTGNGTTAINERIVTNAGGILPPLINAGGMATPDVGAIVKYDGQHWLDEAGRNFDVSVPFALPDRDVFAIDAAANPPVEKASYRGVGSTLFNMAVNPVSGKVYVSNLDARNHVRFEGHNVAGNSGSVRGHLAESRITVLSGSSVSSRHLNKHIDYSQEGTPSENAKSLAFPVGMAVSSDGARLYVAGFGSSKVGIYQTAQLENDEFVPSTASQVSVTGGGPTGMVLDEARSRLYVLTRFDNAISIIDTNQRAEIAHVAMFNPEPASVKDGRRFLYDAALTSSHGDSACASCHIFADLDSLAWDLGDPDGALINNPGPFKVPPQFIPVPVSPHFHPLKGPMTTQSLRGMANHGPMHWRGDRTGGNDAPTSQPNAGAFDEDAAFKKFNGAFTGLLGRGAQLSPAQMQAFTDFMLQVTYPPNPIRALDNSLTAEQAAGRAFYFNHLPDGREFPSDTFHNCNGCHVLDPAGNAGFGVAKPGFFGSDGSYSFESETQFMKVPHLRNAYQKVGMFGTARTWALPIDALIPRLAFLPPPFNDERFQGDQIRGFGFTHDGSVDTLYRFFAGNVFVQRPMTDPFPNPGGIPPTAQGIALRRQLEAFVLAFDSNLAPIVGQQVTLTATNGAVAGARIDLLEARARAGECELVVRGTQAGNQLGWLFVPSSGKFMPNRSSDAALTDAQVRSQVSRANLTFTAVPVGSGRRIALDRNSDGVLDRDS